MPFWKSHVDPSVHFSILAWMVSLGGWLVVGPTLCGWPRLGLSKWRTQLGLPRGFCWFSLRSLKQKRKEDCCGHYSHSLPGWEGRICKHLFVIEVLSCSVV